MQRDQGKQKIDMDRDTVYAQTMAERDRTTAELRLEELRIKRELSMIDYANKRSISLDNIKADLANNAMKLRVQKELSRAGDAMEVATPAAEPPGRAREGHSFEE